MNEWRSDAVSALPRLRQVAFIMAGDEHVADMAVGRILRLAQQRTDDVSEFPCALSWLLAKLTRLPAFNGENLYPSNSSTHYGLSLLDLPLAERLCSVLVAGLKFKSPQVSRIVAEPVETVDARFQRARQMFARLLNPHQRSTMATDAVASVAMYVGQSPSKYVSPLPAPGGGTW